MSENTNEILADVPEITAPRPLKVIAKEIIKYRSQIEQNAVKIGGLLCEAKLILVKHGEWVEWLNENFNLSHRTANRFMRIYEGFANSPALANIGLARTKADVLLRLPDEDRESFMKENNVEELSTRELENRVREYLGIESKEPKKPKKSSQSAENSAPVTVDERIDFLNDSINGLLEYIEESESKEAYDRLLQLCRETIERITNAE